MPQRFRWRNSEYLITRVISARKGVTPDRTHGSGELYVHKHWFTIEVDGREVWTIYFDRQMQSKRQAKTRWYLYTLEEQDRSD